MILRVPFLLLTSVGSIQGDTDQPASSCWSASVAHHRHRPVCPVGTSSLDVEWSWPSLARLDVPVLISSLVCSECFGGEVVLVHVHSEMCLRIPTCRYVEVDTCGLWGSNTGDSTTGPRGLWGYCGDGYAVPQADVVLSGHRQVEP